MYNRTLFKQKTYVTDILLIVEYYLYVTSKLQLRSGEVLYLKS